MSAITLYDRATGRLSGWIEGDTETLEANKQEGNYVEGKFEDDTHYVYGGEVRARPVMVTTLTARSLVNVRPGSVITINETDYDCKDGGDVGLEFDQPGTYKITVSRWPYLDKEFTYEN